MIVMIVIIVIVVIVIVVIVIVVIMIVVIISAAVTTIITTVPSETKADKRRVPSVVWVTIVSASIIRISVIVVWVSVPVIKPESDSDTAPIDADTPC
jgi:hypothetical protein